MAVERLVSFFLTLISVLCTVSDSFCFVHPFPSTCLRDPVLIVQSPNLDCKHGVIDCSLQTVQACGVDVLCLLLILMGSMHQSPFHQLNAWPRYPFLFELASSAALGFRLNQDRTAPAHICSRLIFSFGCCMPVTLPPPH
ncbi:Uncharacterized protein HZ326_5866 [Fusarium oxysporum f. sp. albedinis]|nr:Uncharacterized protein HZ326_5866 [Fusarium oxysporum f. sp. albedinis]